MDHDRIQPAPSHVSPQHSSSAVSPVIADSLLTSADVREFTRLMQDECGESLAPSDAYLRATELVRLIRELAVPTEHPLLGDTDRGSGIAKRRE